MYLSVTGDYVDTDTILLDFSMLVIVGSPLIFGSRIMKLDSDSAVLLNFATSNLAYREPNDRLQ